MNYFKRKKHLIANKTSIDENEVQRLQEDYESRIRILEHEIRTERRSTCNLHEDWKQMQKTVDVRNNEIFKLKANLNELKEVADDLSSELDKKKHEEEEILRLQQGLQDEIAHHREEWRTKTNELNKILQEKGEKIDILRTELNETTEKIYGLEAKLEKESEETRLAVATKERLQKKMEDETRNCRYILKGKDNEIKILRSKLASFQDQLDILTIQLECERNSSSEKEQWGAQIKAELVRCQEELEKKKQHEIILNAALKEKENEIIKMQKEIRNSQEKLENQMLQLQNELDGKNEATQLNIRQQYEIDKFKRENRVLTKKELELYTQVKENKTKEREFKNDIFNLRMRLENRTQEVERLLQERRIAKEISNKLQNEIEKNTLVKSKSDDEIVCLKRQLREVQDDLEIMILSCSCNMNILIDDESENVETNKILADAVDRLACLDAENRTLRDENSHLKESIEQLAKLKTTVKITLNDVNVLKNGLNGGNGKMEDFNDSGVHVQHVTLSGLKDEMNFLNDQIYRLLKINAHQRELLLKKRLKNDKINRFIDRLWTIIQKEENKRESDEAHRILKMLVQVMLKENDSTEKGTIKPATSNSPRIVDLQDPNLRIKIHFQSSDDGSQLSECHLELPEVKKYLLQIVDPTVGRV